MTVSTRNWSDVDHYDALGVAPSATADEIGRAFRALAKRHHPDRPGVTDDDVERFKECTAAYEVLSDPRRRRDYDQVRAEANGVRRRPGPMGHVPKPPSTPMVRWTRRKATATLIAGIVATLLGVAMSVFMVALAHRDAADRAGRVRVEAVIVREGLPPQSIVHFTTTNGTPVRTPLPAHDTPGVFRTGRTVTVLYRSDDPSNIVLDESHFGRDFTLWFVAVKLLVGGPVVTVLGVRRRRRFVAS